MHSIMAHEGVVNGLSYVPSEEKFLSCSDDKIIKLWSLEELEEQKNSFAPSLEALGAPRNEYKPEFEYISKAGLSGIHSHFGEPLFATGGDLVQVWSYERSYPIESFEWGIDSITKVRFNPSQVNGEVISRRIYCWQPLWIEESFCLILEATAR
eukprot:TRINITY_DN1705_c0_g1_i2.p2 TRINITY_DN1705_c0_g1~~TRINITY_DN1705_c0_g1_i2.p2  ORF type:complete len:154 (+),score=28.45 TRINITY_DN1705_c0_g1_i2:380-841(+)